MIGPKTPPLQKGRHYGHGARIVSNRGKRAYIDVHNFRKQGVPAGHYCYQTSGVRFVKGFFLPYEELAKWRLDQ